MHLTSKGQVTIPKKFRDKYGLRQNMEITLVDDGKGLRIVKASSPKSPVERIFGILKSPKSADQLIEEMRGR